MKLTKVHRSAFVKAVIADIPTIDYEDQAIKLMVEDSINQLPEILQTAARDPKCAPYLQRRSFWNGFNRSAPVFASPMMSYAVSPKTQKEVERLRRSHAHQQERIDEVKAKVTGVIEGCATLRQAKERLPDFIKYLPQDEQKGTPNLPALTNIVADLTKLGWPKDKKAA